MRDRGLGSVTEPWACAELVVPGSWAGGALGPVVLWLIVDGAHQCKIAGSRATRKCLSIWARN